MYTAKIEDKSFNAGVLQINVAFTDGVTSFIETVRPQDENGLKYWVKGRLAQLNFATTSDTKYAIGADVDVSDPVVVLPTPTAEELAQAEWFSNYTKWVKIKTTLIDTGVLTGNETKVVALKTKVTNDFLPAYLDII
jgi:hypothetical protein